MISTSSDSQRAPPWFGASWRSHWWPDTRCRCCSIASSATGSAGRSTFLNTGVEMSWMKVRTSRCDATAANRMAVAASEAATSAGTAIPTRRAPWCPESRVSSTPRGTDAGGSAATACPDTAWADDAPEECHLQDHSLIDVSSAGPRTGDKATVGP